MFSNTWNTPTTWLCLSMLFDQTEFRLALHASHDNVKWRWPRSPTDHLSIMTYLISKQLTMDKARVGIKYHGQFPATNLGLSAVQREIKDSFASLHPVLWEDLLKQAPKSFHTANIN